MNGVLVVDKPGGMTSFDVVREVRKATGEKKVGHTGTLDPMATGVLPLCLGEATKIAQFITEASKAYDATLRLGATTDTLDADGKVLLERPVPDLTNAMIEQAMNAFRGTFMQTPPMYSAVKINGVRLYELARAGEEVERAARQVTVHELVLRDFSATEIRLSVRSSKGFFVRTLAAELGEALGCGAHLTALRRTQSGPFTLAQAVPLAKLRESPQSAKLVSLDEALVDVPALVVTQAQAEKVRHGGLVEVAPRAGLVRVVGPDGALLAVAEAAAGRLVYRRVFA